MNPIIQQLNFQKTIKISKSEDSKPKNYQEKQNIYKTTLQINERERERERENNPWLQLLKSKDLEPRKIYDYTTKKYK